MGHCSCIEPNGPNIHYLKAQNLSGLHWKPISLSVLHHLNITCSRTLQDPILLPPAWTAPSPTAPCTPRLTWIAPSPVALHRNSVLQPSNTGNSPSFGVAYITQEQPSPVPYSRLHHQLWRASHGASTRGGLPSPEKCYRSDCFRGQRTLTMASAPAPTRLLP